MKTHLMLTLLVTIVCSNGVFGQQPAEPAVIKDAYKMQSERALTILKYRKGQTAEQEAALKKIHDDYYVQQATVLKARDTQNGRQGRLFELRQKYEKRLETLLGKEQYADYIEERDKIAISAGRQEAAKAKLVADNSKALSVRESSIMKERYAIKSNQMASLRSINDAYYLQMGELGKKEKDPVVRKKKRAEIRQHHEKQLQQLFSAQQYAAYRQDIDSINAAAQKQQAIRNKAFEERMDRFKADTGLLRRTRMKQYEERNNAFKEKLKLMKIDTALIQRKARENSREKQPKQ